MVHSLALFAQVAALVETWNLLSASSPKEQEPTRPSLVPNFRPVANVPHLYRSNNLDDLATLFSRKSDNTTDPPEETADPRQPTTTKIFLYDSERFLLDNATLWLDLRSPYEQDHEKIQVLIDQVPLNPVILIDTVPSDQQLKDLLLRPSEHKTQQVILVNVDLLVHGYTFNDVDYKTNVDTDQKNDNYDPKTTAALRRARGIWLQSVMNEQGWLGLFEAILDSNPLVGVALKVVTIHLEQQQQHNTNNDNNNNGQVVFYCSSGRDRSGMIAMLLQSIAMTTTNTNDTATRDEVIVEEFAKSSSFESLEESKLHQEAMQRNNITTSSATTKNSSSFGMAKVVVDHAPSRAMMQTLEFLRNKYGSVEGYLDSVGFDGSWQQRFRNAVET